MAARNRLGPRPAAALTAPVLAWSLITLVACRPDAEIPDAVDLDDLGTRYAAAWSSQDPDRLASFYAEDGTLTVNGATSTGREAIRATAAAFMSGFPDMRVTMDSIVGEGGQAVFHWTWTGTNTGPGGTGRSVNLQGHEEWTLGPDGRILASDGHYDEAEYRLQVEGGAE
ncbi:MAG: nuclear transport factor 2 family protein [Gemmatimonadota bacterium]|nr:nuclear transport factor 2 family protein [Gemmatimonadota bacterium]